MDLRAAIGSLSAAALIAAAAPAMADDNRGKPGAPRAAPIRVGAEAGLPAPEAAHDAVIGAVGAAASAPPGLRAPDGQADYGYSAVREAEDEAAPALGGGPLPASPNK